MKFQACGYRFKNAAASFVMLALLAIGAALPAAAWAAGGGVGTGKKPTVSTKDYDYYLTGDAADAAPPASASPLLVLMGGGLDVDAAFQQMIDRASGSAGDCAAANTTAAKVDIVIIRTSGADGYNPYLANEIQRGCKVDSVESLVIKTVAGANSDFINERVRKADVLFIAGGDQSTYIALWKGTALDATLKGLRDRNVPFGGTSAGLAVLGDVDYTGAAGSVTSSQALLNPFNKYMTFDSGFLTGLSGLAGAITDSHLVTRDRMGRLLTFVARLSVDLGPKSAAAARGIGVDEATAVVFSGSGSSQTAQVVGSSAAYFLMPTTAPAVLKAGTPLTFRSVGVVRRTTADGVHALSANWTGSVSYHLQAESGALTSSQPGGSPY